VEKKDWTGNSNSIYKTLGASNHTDEEREQDDFYATDPDAVDKLLMVESPNGRIWECAAGAGHLAKRLKEYGYEVYATDIKGRGYALNGVQDFLKAEKAGFITGGYDILTNPPYKYAKEFVQKSLELLPVGCKCYMFLKLQFLEGVARYNEIFHTTPPKAVYVFKKRVLCAKNGDFERMREGGGSAVAYAWFVWEKGYNDITSLGWI
jgi:hypothetical protein